MKSELLNNLENNGRFCICWNWFGEIRNKVLGISWNNFKLVFLWNRRCSLHRLVWFLKNVRILFDFRPDIIDPIVFSWKTIIERGNFQWSFIILGINLQLLLWEKCTKHVNTDMYIFKCKVQVSIQRSSYNNPTLSR